MSEETDPMLGDSASQDKYRAMITQMMKDEANRLHEERRQPTLVRETDPVMLGNMGFDHDISSA